MIQWSPYEQSAQDPELLPSFVCYADILGYAQESRLALKSGSGNDYLKRLRRTLNTAYERVRRWGDLEAKIRAFDVKVFTDNIVVGYPIADLGMTLGEPELGHIFSIFIELQVSLAMEGFFIRGGIAQGPPLYGR